MKNYTVSVPVNCMNLDDFGREKVLEKLKDFDAKRVFLNFEESLNSGEVYFADSDYHNLQMKKLSTAADFFKSNGYEVAAWFWAFKFDTKLPFTRLKNLSGKEIGPFACPSDNEFINFATECVADIARTGVDMIVFNDDFRYGFFSNEITCLCDNHVKKICEILGENLTREELKGKIINASQNKYRDAFLAANKDFFLNFAYSIREKINTINPSIRIGFCAAMSAWDIDGDAFELASALAGNTKPFIRLIGAPYWAVDKSWGNRLQDVIELTRMEVSYFGDKDIELISEGDVWPRPRTKCPAGFLEGYDTALRATGLLDGILKIGLDYTSSPDYEDGYAKFHLRNKPTYKAIESAFSGKKAVGVRVFEFEKKVKDMKNPNELGEAYNPQMLFFSEAARTLACNGIPTTYENSDCVGIAFGENARYLIKENLKNGMIIDIAAAAILKSRGIDTGIKEIGPKTTVLSEIFLKDKNRIIAFDSLTYEIIVDDKAEIQSIGKTVNGEIPLSFVYTNADNERFLVLNLNPRKNDTLMRHYARGYQYYSFFGNSIPAVCIGNPDTYMLCTEDDKEMTIGIWNFSIDTAIDSIVNLDREYKDIEFVIGNGMLCGDKVMLDDINPYSLVIFKIKK